MRLGDDFDKVGRHWKDVMSDAEISSAINAYLADRDVTPYWFHSGLSIDVASAVEAYWPSKLAVDDHGMDEELRRLMLRSAVIQAVSPTP